MPLGRTLGVTLTGLEAALVNVEADLTQGLPTFTITGLPDAACRQSSERIRAAAANRGLPVPNRRITVNLSPASLPKSGAGFDLPMAVAVLGAAGVIPPGQTEQVMHVGELALDGTIRPVHGVLPSVVGAARAGVDRVVVPIGNATEAALVPGITVTPVSTLDELVGRYRALHAGDPVPDLTQLTSPGSHAAPSNGSGRPDRDLADVVGQLQARQALELTAAGGHHLLLVGPPGGGKTLLAECLPSILPPLGESEALEVTAIHSVLGALPAETLVRRPPFVAPHHGASMAALIGGGSGSIRPGLISQAHRGVLFLDEAPEFRPGVLQALRQPMESGRVVVARARGSVTFPARFQLVLAANPCPCGNGYGKGRNCSCTPRAKRDYFGRLAGPLLDRVDLRLDVPAVSRTDLLACGGEASTVVAARVELARSRQRRRLRGTPWLVNAQVPGPQLRRGGLSLPTNVTVDLDRAVERGVLSLRGYDRVLRVAWTIRDLRDEGPPDRDDVGVALSLRGHCAVTP